LIYKYLDDDEYLGFQIFLLNHPESGKIVQGSGGVRKIRWAIKGKGKRGGMYLSIEKPTTLTTKNRPHEGPKKKVTH
jgi:hypothetical protein